jgi:hypothetical protein
VSVGSGVGCSVDVGCGVAVTVVVGAWLGVTGKGVAGMLVAVMATTAPAVVAVISATLTMAVGCGEDSTGGGPVKPTTTRAPAHPPTAVNRAAWT